VMTAIGRPDYVDDPRCTPPITDLEVVRELRAVLDGFFAGVTLEEAGALLGEADVIWAPLATLADVAADPQAHEAGCFIETPDGWGGSFKAPAAPVRFPGVDTSPRTAAPKLGEHTAEVLRELGYDEAQVQAMLADGAATPLDAVQWIVRDLDLLLVMSINPGWGGQQFLPLALKKLREARRLLDETRSAAALEVDGGVAAEWGRQWGAGGSLPRMGGCASGVCVSLGWSVPGWWRWMRGMVSPAAG